MKNKIVIKKVLKMEKQFKFRFNNNLIILKIINKSNKKVIKDGLLIYLKIEKELVMILFIDFFAS